MNINNLDDNSYIIKALNILEINFNILDLSTILNTISLNELKHKYKFLCLKYHPDKNLHNDTTHKFQEITESYHFIELYINERDKKNINDSNNKINNIDILFNNLFNNFENIINNIKINSSTNADYINDCSFSLPSFDELNNLLKNKNSMDNIFILIKHILENTDLLKLVEYDYCTNIIQILKIYKEELSIPTKSINEIENIIKQKNKDKKNIKKISLIPNINNLLNCDLYKLSYEDKIYYIPLWHNQLIYDFDDHNLLVEINPQLDDNITIDKDNNIHINLIESIVDIFSNKILIINIGTKKLIVNSENFKIKEYQTYILKKEGIPIINISDIYNSKKKSNIILHLQLVF